MAFARINPHLFTTTRAGKAEIDQEFNIQTIWVNTLDQRIDDVESQGIAGTTDPANIGKVPVTDGFNISWVKLTLDYLQPNSLNGTVFQNASIPQRVMENDSIGTPQLIDGCATTPKIADGAITPPKIPANSFPFSKFVKPQAASVIGGTTTNGGSWYELPLGDWQIVTKKPQNNGPLAYSLIDVWSGTNGTYDGSKLTDQTVAVGKITVGVNTAGVVGSADGTLAGSFINVDNANYGIVSGGGGNPVAFRVLTNVWNNSPINSAYGNRLADDSVTGSKLADNSIPKTKLQNSGQIAPFAMGFINANGSAQKSMNLGSVARTGTGYYTVRFNTQANDAKYIVVFANEDNGGNLVSNAYVTQGSRNVNGFDVQVFDQTRQGADEGFNFVVYAF